MRLRESSSYKKIHIEKMHKTKSKKKKRTSEIVPKSKSTESALHKQYFTYDSSLPHYNWNGKATEIWFDFSLMCARWIIANMPKPLNEFVLSNRVLMRFVFKWRKVKVHLKTSSWGNSLGTMIITWSNATNLPSGA
jgi:hypothetical protein